MDSRQLLVKLSSKGLRKQIFNSFQAGIPHGSNITLEMKENLILLSKCLPVALVMP